MKKVLFSLFVILFVSLLSSCIQRQPSAPKVTTTVTNEKFTYSDQGFYVEQQIVVSGNTVWGISQKVYGTGMQWREIVALNPFLSSPDRLYYNQDRKMWIVRIYPGEVLNIGGQKVYPSVSYERTITTTTTEPAQINASIVSDMPWWGWMILLAIAILIFINLYNYRSSSSSSSSSAIHVDASNGCDIDIATRAAIIAKNQDFENRALDIIKRDSRKNGRLTSFEVEKSDDLFRVAANYRKHLSRGVPKNEDKEKS